MKYFFILGRNPELSRVEVLSYLRARGVEFNEEVFEDNCLVLDIPGKFNFNIQEFGGVMKIGEIIFCGPNSEFEKFLDRDEVIPSDKFTYSVFGKEDDSVLREKFKRDKKKAVLKHGVRKLKFQDGYTVQIAKTDFSLYFSIRNDRVYLGVSKQDFDSSDSEKRDMYRPVRRSSLAISPRLSKILVNLSGAKKGNMMLDPFCGVGAVLSEALIKGINCFGVDKDKDAIRDAEINLKWLKENVGFNSRYTLKVMDSGRLDQGNFDAIATETPLGEVLRSKPSNSEAKGMITDFEDFIAPILDRLRKCKKKDAKISITFPVVCGNRVDCLKIAKESGLKIIEGPILESREGQFVSRDIVVFK